MTLPALLAAAALTSAPSPGAQDTLPTTPEGWRAAAAEDLTGIHDALRDNSPAMTVSRDSAHFRTWLEQGLIEARGGLPKVKDFRGYYYVMEGYVAGFRDSHIQFGPTFWSINLNALAWPGFVVGWRDKGYEVAYRAPDAPDAPPPGAQLVSCDGQSAEAVARAHDRYDGDLDLAGDRYFAAPSLLLDQGNPFVARPRSCVFRVGGAARTFQLAWGPFDKAHAMPAYAWLGRQPSKLGLAPWGDRRWWISVPSMMSGQDWNGFYDAVKTHLAELRSADAVVIDLRGNGGGDSSFGDRLVRLIWGDDMTNARQPDLGPTVWRASHLNRDNWETLVERAAADPEYSDDDKAQMKQVLALYDTALAHGQPTFVLDDDTPAKRPAPGPDLMSGRVVTLTDSACVSACLDLMDEALAMPGVVQAGTTTSADTIFMELTNVPALPSGLARFSFPHKAWIKRPRGSNVPYVPTKQLTWTGAPDDEAGLRAWLAGTLATP